MRILAQSSGKLVAELLRIISDLEYFLAQGHGCHSLKSSLALSVGFERTRCRITSPCCHVATHSVCCVCVCVCARTEDGGVTLGLHNTGETVATACHWLPLRPLANCQACQDEACYCCGRCQRWAPSSDVVEFRVSQPALVVLTTSPRSCRDVASCELRAALRLVLARPTENHYG